MWPRRYTVFNFVATAHPIACGFDPERGIISECVVFVRVGFGMRARMILGAMMAFVVPVAAHAAVLTDSSGIVLANTGGGFRAVAVSTTLSPGTRVMVRNKGEAKISYSDFCVVALKEGQVHTVGETSPCAKTGGANSHAGVPRDHVLLGAGLAVGAGVAIYHATKSSPASP